MDTAHDLTMLLEAFGQALYAEDASRHTSSAYCADVQHFLTWLVQTMDTCRLDEITPTDIREYGSSSRSDFHLPLRLPSTGGWPHSVISSPGRKSNIQRK